MTASLRLLRIEARRSVGLWAFVPMVGLVWYVAWFRTTGHQAFVLWPEILVGIKNSNVLLVPFLGGLAAWVAGRDHRRNIDELLTTTARTPGVRNLISFAGTTLWASAAYLLAGLGICLAFAFRGTWGTPDLSVVVLGLLGVGAAGAIGYAVGAVVHSRFVASLLGIALFFAQQFASFAGSGVQYLSPVDWNLHEVFYSAQDFALLQALWLVGLTTAMLAAIAFLRSKRPLAGVVLVGALAACLASAVPLVLTDIAGARAERVPVPFEPVCAAAGPIPVCVHPAYEQMLPEAALVVERLVEPVDGLPGAPVRAEQTSLRDTGLSSDGTLAFELYNAAHHGGLSDSDAVGIASSLVLDQAAMRANGRRDLTDAQWVVLAWLLTQAGYDSRMVIGRSQLETATKPFEALEPDIRRAWLEDNYLALRAGELKLADLP